MKYCSSVHNPEVKLPLGSHCIPITLQISVLNFRVTYSVAVFKVQGS